MCTYFSNLKTGDKAISDDHGLIEVESVEVRNKLRFVTCVTVTNDADSSTTFEAVSGELSCPIEWQINTSINNCEARIENGADTTHSFKWLRDEIEQARNGVEVYNFS
jgi:hypothetical protein